MGKRVAIAEEYRFGGTCVIRGCVPKKLFVYASQFPEHFEDSVGYGWTVGESRFDWRTLIANKDREIARLEGLYQSGLRNAGVELIESRATMSGPNSVTITATGQTVTAEHILIAVGGRPNPHEALPGHELCITSDQAFHLEKLPEKIIIAGGGYIAVEFANIFHGLGVETTLLYRGKEILGRFDHDLRQSLHETMVAKGIKIICHQVFERIHRGADGLLHAKLSGGDSLAVDQVMLALGRMPNTDGLGLEKAGIETDRTGAIKVDAFSRTNVGNVYAVGDVTSRVQLTPVAIHEAMCLIDTLYRDKPTAPDHDMIATAVFSQPELGTVGLSEEEAGKRYAVVEVYRASFRPMRHTLSGRQEKMMMKLVVNGADRTVVGAHIMGPDAGEMAQLLAIPMKAGCTKDDFDRTMAVHPTASEELVTMYQPSYVLKDGVRVG
jgi:glutathione reductase (NADPH)